MPKRGLLPEIQQDICDWYKRGWSYKAIAFHLKVTKGQVAGVLWRNGLCKKKQEPFVECWKHGGKQLCATCDCQNRKVVSANNARQDAASAGGSRETQ